MDTHAVVIVDTDGVITSWNEGAVRLFGHAESAAVGQLVDLIIPEPLRDAYRAEGSTGVRPFSAQSIQVGRE